MGDTELNHTELQAPAASASGQALAIRRLGARAGVIGSMLFVTVFTIEGLVRPGNETRTQLVASWFPSPQLWARYFALRGTNVGFGPT
jgi:hypothetical protein